MTDFTAPAKSTSFAARAEDGLAAVIALGIVILPLADVVVQKVFGSFIPGAVPLTAHLTLLVGMAGAAIAARDGKLLSLAGGNFLPEGQVRAYAQIGASIVSSAVATVLAFGGWQLLQIHKEAEKPLVYGIQVWMVELAFPIGFGLMALRLAWNASPAWGGRLVAATGIGAGVLLGLRPDLLIGTPVWLGLTVLIIATICGMPIFGLLGGCALFLYLADGNLPVLAVIPSYDQLISSALPALPLFTIAGFLLAEGNAPHRLLRLFRAFFGWMPGGTAVIVTVLCGIFTTFTGGSGVTILALGGLLYPALIADGYRPRFALGLITAAGSMGLLFPPALPLLMYGFIANVSINDLFIGGLLPGTVMLIAMSALGVREGLATGTPRARFHAGEAFAAMWQAKWELLVPIVIVGALVVGAGTIEMAAIAALFALIAQRYIHRDLKNFADVRRVMSHSIALVGGVLAILMVAVGLTDYLIFAEVPGMLVAWATEHIDSPLVFLLALNGFLIVVGALMDIFSAIVVVVPLITRIAAEYGIDPIHLGIIFIANLELGYLMPPVGENLFLASYRFDKPVLHVARACVPMIIVMTLCVLLITYWPWLTTGLVDWLR